MPIHPKAARIVRITGRPLKRSGTMLAKMITTKRNGMLENTSMRRCIARSNQPPKKPIISPIGMPIRNTTGRKIRAALKFTCKPPNR